MTLEQAAVSLGRAVVYRHGSADAEEGVITSTNASWVFVRYGADKHSKATLASQLELVAAGR